MAWRLLGGCEADASYVPLRGARRLKRLELHSCAELTNKSLATLLRGLPALEELVLGTDCYWGAGCITAVGLTAALDALPNLHALRLLQVQGRLFSTEEPSEHTKMKKVTVRTNLQLTPSIDASDDRDAFCPRYVGWIEPVVWQ